MGRIWEHRGLLDPPRVDTHLDCAVCIIGRGIAGLCIAAELSSRGLDVILLDEIVATTPHRQLDCVPGCFTTNLATPYSVLERTLGPEACRQIVSEMARGARWMDDLIAGCRIPCDLRRVPGTMVIPAAAVKASRQLLHAEHDAANRAGLSSTLTERRSRCKAGDAMMGLEFSDQRQLSPHQFVSGLDHAIRRSGGRVLSSDPVSSISSSPGHLFLICSGSFKVRAGLVVVARERLPASIAPLVRGRCTSVSVCLAYELLSSSLPMTPSQLWDGRWNEQDLTHLARLVDSPTKDTRSPQRLLISAQSYRATSPEALCANAQRWISDHFPDASELIATCARTDDVPANGVPMIGPVAGVPGLFVVLGDASHSLTFAAIAAVRIADALTPGASHRNADPTSPFLP